MLALSHFRKSGKSCAKLIFAENYVQNFALKKIANLAICGNLVPPDLQFSDKKIIIAVTNFV